MTHTKRRTIGSFLFWAQIRFRIPDIPLPETNSGGIPFIQDGNKSTWLRPLLVDTETNLNLETEFINKASSENGSYGV